MQYCTTAFYTILQFPLLQYLRCYNFCTTTISAFICIFQITTTQHNTLRQVVLFFLSYGDDCRQLDWPISVTTLGSEPLTTREGLHIVCGIENMAIIFHCILLQYKLHTVGEKTTLTFPRQGLLRSL